MEQETLAKPEQEQVEYGTEPKEKAEYAEPVSGGYNEFKQYMKDRTGKLLCIPVKEILGLSRSCFVTLPL